ncbi:uncharacterized protein [Venturia canescens]|uniref:uncharacterized protein n=1 Tax=Venturia canescens TaxID=32260 RepID=UPI001C9C04FE|nr:uncharacterized protein LOC122411591 [Venturia canescens]
MGLEVGIVPNIEDRSFAQLIFFRLPHRHTTNTSRISRLFVFFLRDELAPRLVRSHKTSENIIISAQLVRVNTFDPLGRRDLIRRLQTYLCRQNTLETFCMEGLKLKREEGLRLISGLKNSRATLRSLYCWRGFDENQRPIVSRDSKKGCLITCCNLLLRESVWWQTITSFEALTTISLNYSYIATPSGNLLLEMAKYHNFQISDFSSKTYHDYLVNSPGIPAATTLLWLQLLCQESETPIIDYNGRGGNVNYSIPDMAWQATRILAPALKVQLVISEEYLRTTQSFVTVDIPEYDRHKLFFTKHTPVHTFILSSGIDLHFRQPWYIDCTFRNIWFSFPDTLVFLYLQLWHHREKLDHLLCKLFVNLPELQMFEFVGEIRKLRTLCTMCCQIQARQCKVNHVDLQLQTIMNNPNDLTVWTRSIECLLCCFKQDFKAMGVRFQILYYPC